MNTKRVILTAVLAAAFTAVSAVCTLANGLFFSPAPSVFNYPNPFDSRQEATTIVYSVAGLADVKMTIYDLFGNIVREYPKMKNVTGLNRVTWDGTNENGDKVAKGGYLFIIEVAYGQKPIVLTRKIGVIH